MRRDLFKINSPYQLCEVLVSSVVKNLTEIAIPFEKELGQLRPANITAATIYIPPTNIVTTEVKSIFITNVSGNDARFRIFVDQDGTTYDEDTAIMFDVSLLKRTSVTISETIFLNNSAGSIGVRTDSPDDVNFTVYGVEITTK